ncbi:hypothetical protein AMTRI_Chr06g197830 [Amborella trichopoda]
MKIETRWRKEKVIEIMMGTDKDDGGTEGDRNLWKKREVHEGREREICGRKEKYMREEMPDGAEVSCFPGFGGQFPSKHYLGYIALGNEGNGKHVNYYPIVFRTTGCLGMNAIIYFHVPFKIEEDPDYIINGVKVELNPFLWTKVSTLVVMDAPVGTGFSYSDNSEDYQIDDSKTIADLYDFVLKWFQEYPEFLSNPLYITGCSYAGAYVPTLSLEIGNFVGNELIDYDVLIESRVPFVHRMGLISDKLYEDLRISFQGNYWNSIHPDCLRNVEAFKKKTGGINLEHVLLPYSHFEMGISRSTRNNGYKVDCLGTKDVGVSENANGYHCIREIYCYMLNFSWSTNIGGWWNRFYDLIRTNLEFNLMLKGYRGWVCNKKLFYNCCSNGDHDMAAPYIGALEWIRRLNYTELEINHGVPIQQRAGHTVAEYTPHESLVAFERWIDGANNL